MMPIDDIILQLNKSPVDCRLFYAGVLACATETNARQKEKWDKNGHMCFGFRKSLSRVLLHTKLIKVVYFSAV